MIVKLGETKSQSVRDSTLDGILLNIYLYAAVANTALLPADFVPQEVTVKAVLKRKKQEVQIVQDNLEVLGMYCSLQSGVNSWYRGNVITYPGAGVKSDKLHSLFISFGGEVNVKDDDELIIQVICGRSTFGGGADAGISYVEFNVNESVGYELGTPQIVTQVIQANITKERFSLGDNVTKLSILNFDLDNISTPVVNSFSISSDKLSMSLNFFDMLNRHWNVQGFPGVQYRYGNTQPLVSGNEAFPFPQKFPQSLLIFSSREGDAPLNNVVVDASFNSSLVNASKNYIAATRFIIDPEQYVKGINRAAKHSIENAEKVLQS